MRRTTILKAIVIGGMAASGMTAPGHAQTYKLIYDNFGPRRGDEPLAGITAFRGKLFTSAYAGGSGNFCKGCGTLLSVDPKTAKGKLVFTFGGPEGEAPWGTMISINGLLYGVTEFGGDAGHGTVYSFDPKTGVHTVIYSFQGGSDGEGVTSMSGLLNVSGMLYGVTGGGGSGKSGTVFSIDMATGSEKVLYAFQGKSDGDLPFGGLIEVGGLLYGTTLLGGASNKGTVFSVDPATGAEKVLHSFGSDNDGSTPYAGLTMVGGELYGTTSDGGATKDGTIFSVDPATGAEKVLYSFKYSPSNPGDGAQPLNGLTNVKGTLYGTTNRGGTKLGFGTVFSYNVATKTEKVIYSFGTDGYEPLYATLTEIGGTLYGTTPYGGSGRGIGTVYAITP